MLGSPQEVRAETYAVFPDRFKVGRRTEWGHYNRHDAPLDCFLEGPAFDREGNLYVVDIPFGRIFRIDSDRCWTLAAEYDGWPNGLKIHRDGRLYIADHRRGLLVREFSGELRVLAEGYHSEKFRGLNDLHFSVSGDLYFTDQGQSGMHDPAGRVYRLTTSGRLEILLDRVPSPNGLVLNQDENQLYLAVTRANAVWRVPLMPDAAASKVGVWLQLSGSLAGPDGLALDREGGLIVAHPGMTAIRFDRYGRPTHYLEPGYGLFCTNVAFGVHDPEWLYVVDSGNSTILRARMPVPGCALFSQL